MQDRWNWQAEKEFINDIFKYYNRKSMSIPGVISMHNVVHNPAQYNYNSLFQNTLALAFSKAHNTCLFGLFSAFPFPPPEMIKKLKNVTMLHCWMWTFIHLKPAADLKLRTSRDENCTVKLPVLTKWFCVSPAACSLYNKISIGCLCFPVKLKQMFLHNLSQ